MSTRVRFAPSPTGYLHIGGARTALYNYLYARATGGKFILRVEDTDLERSTKEYEQMQIADMKWLGLDYDEGPDKPGEFGPYRQSERMDIYKKYAYELLEQGKAFYDFCSEEELEQMREKNQNEGTAPYTGKWRDQEHWAEAKERVSNGEKAPIRFKVENKDYSFSDKVRGEVKFPAGMVGDFVIMRSNDMPTYNFCNVIDDHLMKITHVIRGDDHTNNTVRQLMIYEAIGADVPQFAHVSLLIGQDRQKLSKRHGATSVTQYREEAFLPEALSNYLCLLGWSHPEEKDIFGLEELNKVFDLERFSKSPAVYDTEKLKWMNGQHFKNLEAIQALPLVEKYISHGHFFHKQTETWKVQCVELFQEKVSLLNEIEKQVDEFILTEELEKTEKLQEILSWETTPQIVNFLKEKLAQVPSDVAHVDADTFGEWMNFVKKELKIKGKPLFMGFRGVLTGQDHGPDLKVLIPLTPVHVLKRRLEQL
jgi:glutamyl-tRNA synthetase